MVDDREIESDREQSTGQRCRLPPYAQSHREPRSRLRLALDQRSPMRWPSGFPFGQRRAHDFRETVAFVLNRRRDNLTERFRLELLPQLDSKLLHLLRRRIREDLPGKQVSVERRYKDGPPDSPEVGRPTTRSVFSVLRIV